MHTGTHTQPGCGSAPPKPHLIYHPSPLSSCHSWCMACVRYHCRYLAVSSKDTHHPATFPDTPLCSQSHHLSVTYPLPERPRRSPVHRLPLTCQLPVPRDTHTLGHTCSTCHFYLHSRTSSVPATATSPPRPYVPCRRPHTHCWKGDDVMFGCCFTGQGGLLCPGPGQ